MISFRVAVQEYEPFRVPVQQSKLSRSEFFRQLFVENKSKVVITEKRERTEDYTKYLNLVNKISNNLNQLAKLLNTAEKAGTVTTQQYAKGLNDLNAMRVLLNNKLGGK